MNCKDMEEKLITYIDGELSPEENMRVKEHLETCSTCMEEYKELKSTIDYVTDNSNNIDTSKARELDLNIKRRKRVKRFTRTGLIAIALSLLLVVTAVATDLFGLMEGWKKSSKITESAWEDLLDNGVGQKLDISAIDKDIKITAEGVISDELNTIILLKIEDLKDQNKYSPTKNYTGREDIQGLTLSGDISSEQLWGDSMQIMSDLEPLYSEIYAEDENTIKLMVWTNPLAKEKGNIDIQIDNLQVITTPAPYVNDGKTVAGNWNLTIPVEVVESTTYQVNETLDMDGQEVDIKQIIIAPTATSIQYGLNPYNKEKDYYIENINFLIKSKNNTYERSKLSFNFTFLNPDNEYEEGEYKIESLYLKNPEEIDLTITNYKARTKGSQSYTIDYDHLPQILEFKDSKITIEEIELSEDSTRIIIKEDESGERKYINSEISARIKGSMVEVIDGKSQNIDVENLIFGHRLESEIRDHKGKSTQEQWSDNHYHYVFKQELIIDKDESLSIIKPELIYIDGLHYKEFPNSKMRIKLK